MKTLKEWTANFLEPKPIRNEKTIGIFMNGAWITEKGMWLSSNKLFGDWKPNIKEIDCHLAAAVVIKMIEETPGFDLCKILEKTAEEMIQACREQAEEVEKL